MDNTNVRIQSPWRVALIDLSLLAAGCLIPTLSHLTALPLYKFSPMVWVMAAGLFLVRDRRNAYLLAVLLPVVSMVAVGMPVPLKCLSMAAELTTLTAVYGIAERWLCRPGRRDLDRHAAALAAAVLCGKAAYYIVKYTAAALFFGSIA